MSGPAARPRTRLTLHHILFLSFTLISAVPVALLGVWVQQSALENEVESVRDMHLLLARNLARAISRYMIDAEAVFRMAVAHGKAPREPVIGLLGSLHFKHICTISGDGTVQSCIDVAGELPGEHLPEAMMARLAPVLAEARKTPGDVAISDALAGPGGNPHIYLALALAGGGYALGAISTAYLVESQEAITFGRRGHAAVVDRQGRVIGHPNPDWRATMKDISAVKPVAAMIEGGSGVTVFYSPATESDMIAGYTVVPGIGWGAMVPQPMSELEERAAVARTAAIAIIVGGIALVAVISWWLAGYLARPIHAVVLAAGGSAGDRLPHKVENPPRRAPRELRELTEAFNTMVEDVTRKNDALSDALDRAEAANRAKTAFLAHMSHETRTPLNAIVGFSELMKNETFGPIGNESYQGYAGDIHHSAMHLLTMVDDVLTLSNAESGSLKVDVGEVKIAETIKSALRVARESAEANGIRLESRLSFDSPVVWTDEAKLRQVLLNLLSNAVKYTSEGGVVTLEAGMAPGAPMRFRISDTGIGVREEELPNVTAPFARGDVLVSRARDGMGLGLPLSAKYVELLGGTLSVKSEVGVGTEVAFELPADLSPNQ